jgi:hypothetical protein
MLSITIATAFLSLVSSGVVLDTSEPSHVVSEMYLNFNIDAASLYQDLETGRLDFENSDLISLGKEFCTSSKSILRIGGSCEIVLFNLRNLCDSDLNALLTAADHIIYTGDASDGEYDQKIRMEQSYWDSIMSFVNQTQCNLVWDLCALSMRNDDGSWNFTNAVDLLTHARDSDQLLHGLQLGNEPGHYYTQHYPDGGATAYQIGQDLQTLRKLVSEIFPADNRPRLIGPDNCRPGNMTENSPCSTVSYFDDILSGSGGVLDGVSVHHYGKYGSSSENIAQPLACYMTIRPLFSCRNWRL